MNPTTPIVHIRYKNVEETDALDALIRSEIARLEASFPRIVSVAVYLDTPHRRHVRGAPHQVRIVLTVPGGEIVVRNAATLHQELAGEEAVRPRKQDETEAAHKDLDLAIHDAFRKAARRLHDHAQKIEGQRRS